MCGLAVPGLAWPGDAAALRLTADTVRRGVRAATGSRRLRRVRARPRPARGAACGAWRPAGPPAHTAAPARSTAGDGHGRAPAAAFRVDQVGYTPGAAKLAALMTHQRAAESAGSWSAARRCRVVAHGRRGSNLGSWSHALSGGLGD